ncbi:MAG: GNAT family N-acetyltransferase [Deltaproteobacteria bacterium RBG_13_58_19]|nr:MAG: GNAT family N-acetyltransferase [Deltaproteobacteria bacterium RBG_13_58_19]
MIRLVSNAEAEAILAVINEAAQAYRGVIPADCWHEPYMSHPELLGELAAGVVFWGYEARGGLVGVMGRQDLREVTLIRHAYVRTDFQRRGIGGQLLQYLLQDVAQPVLVGTWAAAHWAVRFYEQHGFQLVSLEEKERLLRTYWSISERQVDTSVVLALANR